MTYSIRFINYMGDVDDFNEVNLLGPYPDRAARDRDLLRLAALPLGRPEFHGGVQFEASTADRGARVVAPVQVAGATSVAEFFGDFYGWPRDDGPPAQIDGQLAFEVTA